MPDFFIYFFMYSVIFNDISTVKFFKLKTKNN